MKLKHYKNNNNFGKKSIGRICTMLEASKNIQSRIVAEYFRENRKKIEGEIRDFIKQKIKDSEPNYIILVYQNKVDVQGVENYLEGHK